MVRVRVLACIAALFGVFACAPRPAAGAPPLILERTIPLPGVSGRIDHLAIDPEGGRLFLAELGNGSVEAIDLASGRSLGRIGGLKEPQGLGYVPQRDELVVATGGDGMVRFYRAADLKPAGALKLGADADNVRVRPTGQVFVGYGKALAVIDPAARRVVRTIPLPAHPEGFHLQQDRAYVNVPDAGAVTVVDVAQGREIARWRNPGPHFNFPMALEREAREVAVVYRFPAKLVLFTAATGAVEQQLDTCGDADDVFFNRTETRLYVICGSGAVDVFDRRRTGYAPAARVPTRQGARTGLFSVELDRLFVAARARGSEPAAILVFRPGGT
jgi:DNA-binding beta-propeller fold protein YncE